MQEFELKKQEVECINHFLNEVRDNQLLAGVYILAYTKNDEQLGELVVVKKPCKYYLAGLKDPIVISEEYHNHLMQAVEELRREPVDCEPHLVLNDKIDDHKHIINQLNDGYDTILEQGGTNLSGGQRQRRSR